MSLSFDYIVMPPKSQEVSQIQGADQIRYEHNQQENAAQFQQVVKQQSEQTVSRREAENDPNRYDEDAKKRKGSGRNSSRKKQGEKQQKNKNTKSKMDDGHFDMRV